ncbi:PaaI family thioesterase [Sulfodiicoccus acidiphilus]|nr:PaaI family thioesterase [Sulfodiicoccus acidiphilus]
MEDLEAVNKTFEELEPFFKFLKLRIVKLEEGRAVLEIPFHKEITRTGDILHGGAVMTVMDYTGGLTVMTVNDGEDQVTQELKVNFLEPMRKGPFTSEGKIVRKGRTTVVVDLEFRDSSGTLGAKALGTWYILRRM